MVGVRRRSIAPAPYVEAGADMVIPQALTDLWMYKTVVERSGVPVLAGLPERGATPMFTVDELRGTGVALVMYPLSLFHAMNAVALKVLLTIRKDGTQQGMIDAMQTRAEPYDYLDYHAYEARLDQLLAKDRRDCGRRTMPAWIHAAAFFAGRHATRIGNA